MTNADAAWPEKPLSHAATTEELYQAGILLLDSGMQAEQQRLLMLKDAVSSSLELR